MRRKDILDQKEIILDFITNNKPKNEICRFLKCKAETLDVYLKKMDIEYKGNQGLRSVKESYKTPYTDYTEKGKKITTSALRIKLIEQGVKDCKCEVCGLSEWMDKPIPLELHHINEDRYDNRLENLMILCSNCHMQIHNYSNLKETFSEVKKVRKVRVKDKKCDCGVNITSNATHCLKCNQNLQRKIKNRPDKSILLKDIEELGYKGTGNKYGVSDNAIRKWLK